MQYFLQLLQLFNYSYDRLKLKHMSLVNYGFSSNKQDAAVQQETEEKLQNNKQSIVKTKKQQLSKRRKWNDAFTELGFVKDLDENNPSARCVFCQVIYDNSSMEKYKLKRHRDTKHSEHKIKSATFFKQQTRRYTLQQQQFEQLMVARSDQPLVISSLKTAHVLMSQKQPFILAESVLKFCLEIVAQEIQGVATAVTEVQKLSLSDNTMQRRCSMIAASLKEIVLAKLRLAPCFGLQLDETADITSKVQMIVYVCIFLYLYLFIFILHSRESELYRYILDGTSALAWELPFLRCVGHLSST